MPNEKGDSKEDFAEAVKNDEYAEYHLGDEFYLVTDWTGLDCEGNGPFRPYVVVPENCDREMGLPEKQDEELSTVVDVHLPYDVICDNILCIHGAKLNEDLKE